MLTNFEFWLPAPDHNSATFSCLPLITFIVNTLHLIQSRGSQNMSLSAVDIDCLFTRRHL